MIKIIDLNFFTDQTIASFLVETSDGPFLVETGPDSTYKNLEKGLHSLGYEPGDIRNVLLTHIHLDHAGAAWHFGKMGATIHVHSKGGPHMVNPDKLLQSAGRIYGDQMDYLWGKMEPIPDNQVKIYDDNDEIVIGDKKIRALYTPGHAQHHLAYEVDGVVFTGDVGGVRIGGVVEPPCPPPDINIEIWRNSINKLRDIKPDSLYLTHFGKYDDVADHLDELERRLRKTAEWMRKRMKEGKSKDEIAPEFEKYVKDELLNAGMNEQEVEKYEYADPAWMSVGGLMRYWNKYHPEEI